MPNNSNSVAHDDDIYIQDGDTYQDGIYYPEAPKEQQAKLADEQAVKAASYPILAELHKWFADEVKDCDNIHNIQVSKMTINGTTFSRTVSVEAQVLAMQILKEKLSEKAKEFETFAEAQS